MMTRPVLMVVDDDPASLDALAEALRHRYEHDYLIISKAAPGAAVGRLRELRAAGHPVAMVMAAAATTVTPAMSAAEFLAEARGIHPGAKRVIIVPRGGPGAPGLRVPVPLLQDRQAAAPVLRGIALGVIDTFLPAPAAGRDERFHRTVSEMLEEWTHVAPPVIPAVRIIAPEWSARAHELRDVLARDCNPYTFNAAESAEGQWWLRHAGQDGSAFPVLVMYTGEVLVDPPIDRIAAFFGVASLPAETVDVAIVGAGPAGLSAAVYTVNEDLSTLLLEREAFGGQAGSSSLIRNYLGFPRGVGGESLATRAFQQAWSFGVIPSMQQVTGLAPVADGFTLSMANGGQCRARSVLIATGVSYRRLDAPGLDSLLGAGVFYGATTSEASAFAGEQVFVAGGANSAGQAAIHWARYARQVTILVRGDSLADRMSRYLIDEISATANIDVRTSTQIAAAAGAGKLEALTLLNTKTDSTQTVPAAALVVLIGGVPHTDWLPPQVCRDNYGFVVTGSAHDYGGSGTGWTLLRPPFPLETTLPGVFAAGDVRHGSVNRLASAAGEGSLAATQLTQCLREQAHAS